MGERRLSKLDVIHGLIVCVGVFLFCQVGVLLITLYEMIGDLYYSCGVTFIIVGVILYVYSGLYERYK